MNKKSKVYILSILLMGLILIIGTYAWFTWRSSESRLVLTIGEIDDAQVILKPYKIDKEIIPVLTYEGEEYTEVEAINKNNNTKMITLYYHINNIDNELISSDFKYTILRSSDNGNTYSEYITGNFSNTSNDSDLYIMEETIETNMNYKYQVYLWLDGSDSGQGNISGKVFNGELRAEITGGNIKVDVPDGLIPITYDVFNGTKVKTISSDDSNWYDYNNKEWANAVLVGSGLTSSSAYDLSGNNTENTINGTSYDSEGLSFDGVDDYVLLPQYNISTMTNGFTMEVRFKANNVSSTTEQDLFVSYHAGGAGIHILDNKVYAQIYDGNDAIYVCTGQSIESSIEYVATLVFDKTDVKLYLNGVFVSSVATSGKVGNPIDSTHFTFGCNPKGTTCQDQYFNGTISQARMYDRALSDSEVLNNYNDNITKNNLLFAFDYKDGKRSLYKNTSGVEIPESDILAYYVYVPRYKYKIWTNEVSSAGKEQEIKIVFENNDTSKSMGTKVGEYRTHPAFTFGDIELNGIWVGKFETSHTTLSSSTVSNNLNCMNENCKNADGLRVLPNMQSLRYNNVSNFYFGIRSMQRNGNPFGIDNRSDSHMIKNSEWGAVAYLSHSKYGRCINGVCEDIRRNNNSSYSTGYSEINLATTGYSTISVDTNQFGTTSDITQPYNTEIGYKASTTGNITGIYDVSGGAWEYVMGVLADSSGNPRSGYTATYNSGFNGMLGDGSMYTSGIPFPDKKYYDIYISTDSLTACNGGVCYGHGLSEVNGWYIGYADFATANNSWSRRGGMVTNGVDASAYGFHFYYGNDYPNSATRAVLSVIS